MSRDEIFQNALALSEDDRVQLAGLLLARSDEVDADWQEAWKQELDRRAAELDSARLKRFHGKRFVPG